MNNTSGLDSSRCIGSMINSRKEGIGNAVATLKWVDADDLVVDDSIFHSDLLPSDASKPPCSVASAVPRKKSRTTKGVEVAKKYKKAPEAPRRFKSAFIFFSIEKHREIRESLQNTGQKEKTTNVAKMVSEAWKGMCKEEREIWEDKARKDRARYEVEAASYNGPWKVIAKRAKKPQDAPKRPMSAFLSFSNKRRMHVMRSNPNLTQGEISALLSKMWNEAPAEVRDTHMNQELEAREIYKRDIAAWRERDKEEKSKRRSARETKAAEMADATNSDTIGAHTEPLALVDMLASLPSEDYAVSSHTMVHDQNFARHAHSGSTACFEPQQLPFQQLSDDNQRQQETLDSLIRANMTAIMGFQQQTMTWQHLFSNNVGFQPQQTLSLHQQRSLQTHTTLSIDRNVRPTVSLQHYGGIDNFQDLNILSNAQGRDDDNGMMDWVDFALGE